MSGFDQSVARNHLLAGLSRTDFARVSPHLRRADLPLRTTLHGPGEPIATVYFPETGYVSLLAALEDGDSAEVGMVGYEGVVGVPLILGDNRSAIEAMVQDAGTALIIEASAFRRALDESSTLLASMLRYAMAFNVQVAMTAACNGRHLVEQRLARWLLMAHDRSENDEFAMTHEFLSTMLGVRRAGVTVAAGKLQKAGYIRYGQGRIKIADRPGLEAAACECHRIARSEFERLLGPPARNRA